VTEWMDVALESSFGTVVYSVLLSVFNSQFFDVQPETQDQHLDICISENHTGY